MLNRKAPCRWKVRSAVILILFSFFGWGEIESTFYYLAYCTRPDDDDCGSVGGMNISRGNRSTRRKHAPVPLCPPQIPHTLTWDRTRAAAMGTAPTECGTLALRFGRCTT
jgi:hypothetical protein